MRPFILKTMRKNIFWLVCAIAGMYWTSCSVSKENKPQDVDFVKVDGHDLITPDGEKLLIKGTNLGNWLNPEGYMFGFGRTNSAGKINEALCEVAGPEFMKKFWKKFKDQYITKADIDYIASQGVNTIRVPFHYKLFTDEDYMGLTGNQDGYARLDSVVEWCREDNLYVILDMHDAPAGQTGDNIDDSYGYPWLMESPEAQEQFYGIWREIADHYKNEPVILGYELINEPVATYFENQDELNGKLMDVYKQCISAIREVDPNHIILIGAPQWNSNFSPVNPDDFNDDPQVMYTCHRYGGPATAEAIGNYIEFRNRSNRPMYMGEIGHNTDQWQADFVAVMKDNNIGYTFWPYKKCYDSCMNGFGLPESWKTIVSYAEGPHETYSEIREAKVNHQIAQEALTQLLDSIKFENCHPNLSYINSLGLK